MPRPLKPTEPQLLRVRRLLDLVRMDPPGEDLLNEDERAWLFIAALHHEGYKAHGIFTQLRAMRNEGVKFTVDLHAVEVRVKTTNLRMNLVGDIDEQVIPGFVRAWEQRCQSPWPGTSAQPGKWYFLPKADRGEHNEAYFHARVGRLLSAEQAQALEQATPPMHAASRPSARL